MERHTRLSRAAVVLVTIALIASIAAAVWFASPDAPYVPSEDSGAALGTAAPAEDGTVASGYQPSGTEISDGSTAGSAIQTIRNSGNGTYHLTDNIVVNSLTDCVFSGTLDGNGKTVYIRYDSEVTGEPDVDPEYVGIGALFGNLNGATIKNVKIVVETFRYVEGSAGTRNVGIIAGDAWGGVTIENVYVELRYNPTSDGRSYFLDSGEHAGSFWSGTTEVELNFGAVLGKSGSSDATTDVTLKNVTVDNQTSGNYGFSAWIRHGDYCNYKVSMGHFVGWVTGELSMQNCTLRGGESAKMTIKRGGSDGSTTNQSGAVIGRLDEQSGSKPSLTIAGLDMEMAINFDDHVVMNNISGSNGIIYGSDADNSWTVNVQDIYWNQNSGNPGWYDGQGNDTITYSNLTKYDPNVIDISFDKDGDKVLLSAKAQYVNDASSIVNQIAFNGNTYTVWDKLIATGADTVGQWTQVATVDAPNSSSGGNVTYTTMGTGTFSLEGGETITGVSGNAYTAAREYDGNPPQSPSVVLSDNGGSYADVWKTTNASANVGQYMMTFDKNAFTDAVVATGSDGLTYIAKNGIVYSPGSMEQIGQLNIVNNINVNITQASVTVTPNVPTDDLYAGNPLPELTVTAVDSGGSPVEGSIAWDDPDATLVSGKHSYNWTWTPNSDNYQSYSGTVELNVLEKQIVSIEVTKAPKTEYVAYDAFDSTGIEVTATYSDDTTAVLTDEYAFKIVGADGNEVEGGLDKLFVAYKEVTVYLLSGSEVTTTISINVDYVRFVMKQKAYNKDITYGDSYQWNAADFYTWSDNTAVVDTYMDFYEVGPDLTDDISGIATEDAGTKFIGRVWSRAFYQGEEVPEAEYDNFIGIYNPDEIALEVTLTIVPRKIEIESSGIASGAYSGEPVDLRTLFTAQSVNDDVIDLSFDITLNNETCDEVRGAGTYSVTASLAESETNYTAEPVTITYTVTKLAIPKPQDAEEPIVYDGKVHDVTPTVTEYKVVNGTTKETDAGNYSCTIALTDKANTEWEDGTSDDITVTWSIIPMTIAGTVSAPTDLTYDGNAKEATFTLSSGELFNGDAVTIEYSGDNVDVSGGAITATANLPSDNYAWEGDTAPSATFTISPKEITVTATSGSKEFAWIMASASELYELFELDGEKVNAEDKLIWKVNGEVADMSDGNVSEIFDAKEYKIEIASADANYTLTGQTSTTFTITPKQVEKPTVSSEREFTYNGGEQGFTIVENDEYTVTGTAKATDAGEYSFTIALKAPGNVVWSDDSTGDITVDWKINKATFESVTIEFAEGALDNLFTSSAMPTPTTITANPTPLPAGVKGKFAWVESSLSEDTNTYHWTYTVPNYNVFNGTQELTAQAAVLESITLSGEYETEYTAYDFFDVENLVVTAHFSHGENQPGEDTTLALGEYTLTTASAKYDENGVPQLFVADDHVTVTYQGKSEQIVIKVAPKQIAAPNAATGLVYDGTEKDGVTGGDGYTLSGDTKATDANDYFATAVLTDKDNTTWTDGTTDDKTIEWSIAKMVVSGSIVAPESLVYDGAQKAVSFDGQLAGNDKFGIAYDGDRQNVTADGFTVTVSLPNDNNYEWADGVVTTAAYKIEPKRVYLGHGDYTWGVSYNGKAILVAELGGNTGDGNVDLVFAYEDETLETKLDIVFDYVAREANGLTSLVDAGEYTIEFNLADSVVNYVADPYTTTLEITPMRVEATLTAPNEVYTGNEKDAILTVNTQLVGEDKVTVEYNNVNRIDYTGEEIVATAQLPNDNYVWADGTAPTASFTIQKATITSVTVTVSDTPDGGWTTAMMPEFTSVSVEPYVEGEVVWNNGSLIAGENKEQPWTFVPDSPNYEPYHGAVTLTVAQATLTGVSVEVVATTEYVAFDPFDRSSIAVEALYGEDRKPVTTGYRLTFSNDSAEGRLLAGTGITVTVAYTDGGVTQSTAFTIDVAKRTVAKPVVGDTTFEDNGGQITLEIAPSEFYTVTGNTGFGVGSYQATVSLVDADNTMWADGSTDVVSIAWTITEPVTSDEVIASIRAMEKVTWQNAEEFLDLEARYNALDESEQTAEATAKIAVLRAQYDALRNAAFDDIEAAHEVTAKSLGKALAAAAAGLSAAAIALAIAKRRSI